MAAAFHAEKKTLSCASNNTLIKTYNTLLHLLHDLRRRDDKGLLHLSKDSFSSTQVRITRPTSHCLPLKLLYVF
jgi:hypothetical protein